MPGKSIPQGYHTVNPYLFVHNIDGLIDFLKQVFNAQEIEGMHRPDGDLDVLRQIARQQDKV